MKKLLRGSLAILCAAIGLQKLADNLNTDVKSKAIESERVIAGNGSGYGPKGESGDKGKSKS